MLTIEINGDNFFDLETFHLEIDRVLTKNLNRKTGHNLNAFNDLLWGGFGVYDYEEPVSLIWLNFSKSQNRLGQELVNRLKEIILAHKHVNFTAID
jgi:RNAse (barnase) inhibitor barstar